MRSRCASSCPTAAAGAALFAAEDCSIAGMPPALAAVLGFLILDLCHLRTPRCVPQGAGAARPLHDGIMPISTSTSPPACASTRSASCISLAIGIPTVTPFGIPAIAVLLFEVVLNATSMFNHANVSMPAALDRVLRLLVVTPDMHRVHHSILRNETDSNFGFNLPWWDRLFGTYRAAPAAGHHGMTIGLPIFRNPRELRVDRLLTQPFRDDTVAADDDSGSGGKRGDPRNSPGR